MLCRPSPPSCAGSSSNYVADVAKHAEIAVGQGVGKHEIALAVKGIRHLLAPDSGSPLPCSIAQVLPRAIMELAVRATASPRLRGCAPSLGMKIRDAARFPDSRAVAHRRDAAASVTWQKRSPRRGATELSLVGNAYCVSAIRTFSMSASTSATAPTSASKMRSPPSTLDLNQS